MQNPQPGMAQGVNLVQNPQPGIAQGANLVQNPQPGMAQGVNLVQNPQPGLAEGVNLVQNPQPGMAQGVNLVRNPQPGIAHGVNLVQNPQPGNGHRVNLVQNPQPGNGHHVNLVQNPQPGMAQGVFFLQNPQPRIARGVNLVQNPQPRMAQGVNLVQNPRPVMPHGVNLNPNLQNQQPGIVQGVNLVQNPQAGIAPGVNLVQNPQPGMAHGVNSKPNQTLCGLCNFVLGHNSACADCYNHTLTRSNELKREIEDQRTKNSCELEALEKTKEEAEFLRKWDFTSGEASSTTDVTIVCNLDGTLFHAHSFILASKSDVFRAMLEGNERKEVHIDGFPGNIVKAFVKFLYTGELSREDRREDSDKELVKVAHFYGVKHLTKRLDEKMSKALVVGRNSIIEAVKLAYLHGLKKTKQRVHRIMAGADPSNELFNRALKELYEVNTAIAHQFSVDIINQF